MTKSKIALNINLDTLGKFSGYAKLPYSVNRSAYGSLPIPVVSIRGGPGKTVLLLAGTHGDEFEGQVTLTKLAQELDAKDVSGQLIIVPMANYPAAKAGHRVSPIDQGNLNRLYPGDPNGSSSEMIAHFIETELMARADFVFDLHSGGASLNYLPATTSVMSAGSALAHERKAAMEALGAPYGLIFTSAPGAGSSSEAAARRGIPRLGTELGGRGWVHPVYSELCEVGVRRVLGRLGVIQASELPLAQPVTFLSVDRECFVYATAAGVFEGSVTLGAEVKQGDCAGKIYFPETPLRLPEAVHFAADGIVVCERAQAMCEIGDCLYHLGKPQ
ncbi:succinylglutamate desuccinylase/aspartoacylase family protein [Cupriavidus pauculus]|uniref:succinylglutamate desuccinylase/aspartoacylase family protein n=1 Tax=Cupriavidus pauculus TaxID=82633 RepID=UPI001EE2EFC1|nr:succinylglutamate desuccinylase/aspartoacylase family protein [Cupriavidus pauculus]GJG97726.1 succinylglutamate desuccinylase/aspartoacylase family protein [Cupriavidus pauculus]